MVISETLNDNLVNIKMGGKAEIYLEYAHRYARNGWHVFPVYYVKDKICSCGRNECQSAGKHPIPKNGLKDASSLKSQVHAWWDKFPEANIAIYTGEKTGLVVLDINFKSNGFESLEQLESEFHSSNTDKLHWRRR